MSTTTKRASAVAALVLLLPAITLSAPAGARPQQAAHAPAPDIFKALADEVSTKMLESPAFRAKADGTRKAKIVIGDVRNNSDDEQVRVDDIFNEIRNQIVAAGTARLFAPGALDVDFIIAPELTSQLRGAGRSRVHCFTLQLTLTTVSGEYIAAHSAERC